MCQESVSLILLATVPLYPGELKQCLNMGRACRGMQDKPIHSFMLPPVSAVVPSSTPSPTHTQKHIIHTHSHAIDTCTNILLASI